MVGIKLKEFYEMNVVRYVELDTTNIYNKIHKEVVYALDHVYYECVLVSIEVHTVTEVYIFTMSSKTSKDEF